MDTVFLVAPTAIEIANILKNARNALGTWGGIIIAILGAAALIVAAYMIVSGLISHGKKQTSWLVVIALVVVGGLFVTLGFNTWATMTQTGDAEKILKTGYNADGKGDAGWLGVSNGTN
jgi:hypothetical protein